MPRLRWPSLITAAVLAMPGIAAAQIPETFTATAVIDDGATNQAVEVMFVIDRYTTDAENTVVLAALKEGTPALQKVLAASPDIGSVMVAGTTIPLKDIYRRPQSLSRTTLLSNVPLAFLDPGGDRGRATTGFDFTLVTLDFSLPGFGAGKINPAAKIEINSSGQIETEGYGAAAVRLTDLKKR